MIPLALSLVFATAPVPTDVALEFRVAVGEHYHQKPEVVATLHSAGVDDEELPVVLYFADHARVEPKVILALRKEGLSWWQISTRYKIGAEAYYVEFEKDPGPPYGNAWGYYKKHPRAEWSKIVLTDADLVAQVNLRFLSVHFDLTPDLVVEYRKKSKDVDSWHAGLKEHAAKVKAARAGPPDKGGPGGGPARGKDKGGKPKGRGGKGKGRGGQ